MPVPTAGQAAQCDRANARPRFAAVFSARSATPTGFACPLAIAPQAAVSDIRQARTIFVGTVRSYPVRHGLRQSPAGRERRSVSIRSEEHTSELQSLMRISYAVFCLKKKTLPTMSEHHLSYVYKRAQTLNDD